MQAIPEGVEEPVRGRHDLGMPGSRSGSRAGTAHILDNDDPRERLRVLSQSAGGWRRLCFNASRAMSTSLLTVRIDLDPR